MAARGRCISPAASRGIGFKDIITFQFAAAFSAFGCTTADFMRRHSVSTQIDIPAKADDDGAGGYRRRKVTAVWNDLTKAAVDEMIADGHAREKIKTVPFLMMRYTGQLEDVEVMAPLVAVRFGRRHAQGHRASSRRSMPRSITACRATARPASRSPSSA